MPIFVWKNKDNKLKRLLIQKVIHDNDCVAKRIVTILDTIGVYVDYHLIEQIFGINNVTILLLLNDTNRANDYHNGKLPQSH